MTQSNSCSLLKQEAILLHPANRVEVVKDNSAIIKHPAVETGKVAHAKEGKEVLGLHLDGINRLIAKAWRAVVGNLAGR